eukprot:SAG31_NODE_1745_length_7379_cov_8.772115_1_plen_159_part_00
MVCNAPGVPDSDAGRRAVVVAPVFPDPVGAQESRSRPASMPGIDWQVRLELDGFKLKLNASRQQRLAARAERCPELQNRGTDSPMISNSSGVPVLQFGTSHGPALRAGWRAGGRLAAHLHLRGRQARPAEGVDVLHQLRRHPLRRQCEARATSLRAAF